MQEGYEYSHGFLGTAQHTLQTSDGQTALSMGETAQRLQIRRTILSLDVTV